MSRVDPIPFPFPAHEAERFWSQVKKDECWIFEGTGGGKHTFGYRWFYLVGRGLLTHRLAWVLTHGPIPAGLQVLHNCPGGDNPACCNPAHLFLGTQGDNIRDCIRKGRWGTGRGLAGSSNNASKLTETDIPVIRARFLAGDQQAAIARDYKVSKQVIGAIVHGRTWKHVV